MMPKFWSFLTVLLLNLLLPGCVSDSPVETSSSGDNFLAPGDIIVVSSSNDTVLVLDEEGNYKDILYDIDTDGTITFGGLAWDATNEEVLLGLDSTTAGMDKILAISAVTGEVRTLIQNVNWTGTVTGIVKLTTGEILVTETNGVEKFTAAGVRVVSGLYPIATLMTTPQQLGPLASGGFIACGTGTDEVRFFNAAGTQVDSATSTVPTPALTTTSDAYGCMEMASGNIAAVYNGTNDTIRIYDSTMTTVVADYSNTTFLADPRQVTQRSNGNLLVTDATFHYIVEVTSAGAFVDILGGGVLSAPTFIMVVPTF